ncbi:hypothetical protein [Oscillatoria acuminata]|uniref:hypothetical protein n=1 Tax=Oscillatoria acuminata TaxID=118323 RepID=UPI0005C5D35D|nr:hypothetical protein [Oscillatoria acuminata]
MILFVATAVSVLDIASGSGFQPKSMTLLFFNRYPISDRPPDSTFPWVEAAILEQESGWVKGDGAEITPQGD